MNRIELSKLCKINVSRETFEKYVLYEKILNKWQASINLVSRGTLGDFWIRHIVDSLQIVPYLRGKKILDIGSGAGFPGMVVAMLGEFDVTCVDSDSKKMIFLEELSRETGVKVVFKADRIENVSRETFHTVCCRGFASVSNIIPWIEKFSNFGVLLKGSNVISEIQEAKSYWSFSHDVIDSVSDSSGKILIVKECIRKH